MKEIEWKKEWFPSPPKYSPTHWESKDNQRIFLDEIAAEYSIVDPKDWKRASSTLIKKHGGYVDITIEKE